MSHVPTLARRATETPYFGGRVPAKEVFGSTAAQRLKMQEGRRPDARQEHSFLDFTLEVLFLRP